ncbi:MAG: hypothetical protein KDB01_05460 [Planctomycetaceae bacterium]|nr:hypothetical protein [Planctomycetaceae bacterium]
MTAANPTLASRAQFKPIFTGGKSLLGLRVLSLLFVVIWYFGMRLAYETLTSHGLNPVDGYDGQLAPLSHRIGISLPLALVISGAFFFMVFMAHQVVTRILLSEDHETLRIETMGFWRWGRIEIPQKHLLSATKEDHRAGASTVTVPRLKIRIQNRKWSLWIQQPGNVLDDALFRQFVLRKKRGR